MYVNILMVGVIFIFKSFHVGMQNSALAAVLAQSLPNPSLTALPACISATTHSVLGSLLAGIWRFQDFQNLDKKFLNRYALKEYTR